MDHACVAALPCGNGHVISWLWLLTTRCELIWWFQRWRCSSLLFRERFVGLFKLAVAERRSYQTLGAFLRAAEQWVNFYNQERPHESLKYRSPNQYAQVNNLPIVPYIPVL